MELVECGHCPSDRNRWPVLDGTPDEAIEEHIAADHPNTGAWVRGDDWDVLSADDVLALDQTIEKITA